MPDLETAADLFENEELQVTPEEPEEKPKREKKDPPPQVVVNVQQSKQETRGRPSGSTKSSDEEGDDEFNEIFKQMDADSEHRYIVVERVEPRYFKGVQAEGYIGKFTEMIDREFISQNYGGGKYSLRLYGPRLIRDGNPVGAKIVKNKYIKVPGDPIINSAIINQNEKKSDEPGIVESTLKQTHHVINKMQEEKEALIKRTDELSNMVMSNALADRKSDHGPSEVVDLMKSMMDQQTKNLELQLMAAREDAKRAREEQSSERALLMNQMSQIRLEMDRKASDQVNPFIELMKSQAQESKQNASQQASMMVDVFKSQMEMMRINAENQQKMQTESSKMQVELLTSELKRLSDELKDTRSKDKGGLMSELKNFSMIKKLFNEEAPAETSFADKLISNLPEIAQSIPSLVGGIGALIGKGNPVAMPPQQLALPQPQPQAQEQQVQAEEPQGDYTDQMKLMVEVNKLKITAEAAIGEGKNAEQFVKENIDGNYDKEVMQRIAALDTNQVIAFVQGNLEPESPLATVSGKDFLRHVHRLIKNKFSET